MLSVCTDELLPTPKIITILSQYFKNEKSERQSNPIPHSEYEYLSGSSVLVNLTAPNKESLRVKVVFKFRPHASDFTGNKLIYYISWCQILLLILKYSPLQVLETDSGSL